MKTNVSLVFHNSYTGFGARAPYTPFCLSPALPLHGANVFVQSSFDSLLLNGVLPDSPIPKVNQELEIYHFNLVVIILLWGTPGHSNNVPLL